MSRFDGFDEARKLLQSLGGSHRDKLIEDIAQKDPTLAEKLKKAMLRFEDLKYLTADMVRLLMKEVSNDKLGLALRAADKELIEHFKSNMSSNNQKDLDDVLNGKPQPASKVQEAQDEILDIVRAKQATGEIVIDKSGSETYV